MVLLVLFIFVIYGVFHRAVDLAAAFQNTPDLLLAVMQRFQMEAVIVAGVHRIQNGDQTADGIVHRRQEFTVLGGIDASIKQVAYRDYMYGRDGVIEEWLSKCEGKWSQVVRYLLVEDDTKCTEPLEYYLLLLHFVQISLVRTAKNSRRLSFIT